MKIDPGQRAYQLVEELRAEVDFEIDDVIAEIIRNLPEEYFLTLTKVDQIKHLKTLLAISICQLNDWLTLKSDNDRQIAVLARQNYSGMLANIIASLPRDRVLIGAKIFTSTAHDFIIDLFQFAGEGEGTDITVGSSMELDDLVAEVVRQTGAPFQEVQEFLTRYPQQAELVTSAAEVKSHFEAFQRARQANADVVFWQELNGLAKVTIASPRLSARDLFLFTAQALSQLHADVERAFLYDFPLFDQPGHVAVASFMVAGDFAQPAEQYETFLLEFLGTG